MAYFHDVALSIETQPVCMVMCSLLQLKSIQATPSQTDIIIVMTANGFALGQIAEAFENARGFSIFDLRIKILGYENNPGFETVALAEKVDVA